MKKPKGRRLKVAGIIAIILSLIAWAFWKSPLGGMVEVSWHHYTLTKRDDLPEIAEAMRAILTDGDDKFLESEDVGFPPILKELGARWLIGRPYEVMVEFGGGFYHYGYRLEKRDSASGSEYYLISYGEYPENDQELLKLPWRDTESSNKTTQGNRGGG